MTTDVQLATPKPFAESSRLTTACASWIVACAAAKISDVIERPGYKPP